MGRGDALLVVSCAARSPEAATHTLPPLGRSALVGCLALFALKATVRRRAARPPSAAPRAPAVQRLGAELLE